MKAEIGYEPGNPYGFKDKQEYQIKVGSVENNRIDIRVDFPYPNSAEGLSKDAKVGVLLLSMTNDEAEKIIAALNAIIHLPLEKNKFIEWENK